MKKFVWIFLFAAICICLICFFSLNVTEEVKDKNTTDAENAENFYNVSSSENTLYFSDENGNGIFYEFEEDRLISLFMFVATKSLDEAEAVKTFYNEQLNSGDIQDITTTESGIYIMYSEEYLEQFKDYTKSEFENLILQRDLGEDGYEQ